MASVNKVILIGNLGKDPETRYMSNGDAVTNITLATTDTWKDKNGEKQEKTEWHRVTFYRKLAEIAGEYLKKGRSVYVEGRLENRGWTDKNGVERYTTEIIAESLQMLGSAREKVQSDRGFDQSNTPRKQSTQKQSASPTGSGFDDMDDDIPF